MTGGSKNRGQPSKLPRWAGPAVLAALLAGAVALWNTPLVYPLKIFVVVLHEAGHAIAALLAGGSIVGIEIGSDEGGLCRFTLPGDAGFLAQAFVASAGYLGSMLLGGLILLLAARTRLDRWITAAIGAVILVLSFFVLKGGGVFGILYCLASAALLLLAARWFPPWFHDTFLKLVGLVSCLYVVVDIKEDLIDRTGIGSDADAIARMLGAPRLSIVVGIAWAAAALVLLGAILFLSFRRNAPRR